MNTFFEILDFIWGIPLTIIIVLSGLYFCYCNKFLQLTKIKTIYNSTIKKLKKDSKNSFKTITSVLGGTIGTGNVAGVATAIAIGGPGAIFWMWLIALFGMATKMVEVTLAVKYHEKESDGYIGGPMYYMKKIKGNIGKTLAFIYVVFLLIYVLCDSGFVQMNTASSTLIETFNMPKIYVAIILIGLALIIIKGGLERVSNVLKKLVPSMFVFYFVVSIITILLNYKNIPSSFITIFKYAFSPAPAIGGFAGASVVTAISKGAARGIFANEAGTGTSTMVHATSENEPIVQGMWGIFEVFIVSFVICTLTALLIMTTGVWESGSNGAPLVLEAFSHNFGSIGKYILCFVIVLFACSTYIGYFYEYNSVITYLFGKNSVKYLKWGYAIPIVFAIYIPIEMIWSLADCAVGFIVIPNLIALIILSKEFKKLFNTYMKKNA